MKKSRFSEEQIIQVFAEGNAGGGIDELCRKHGISKGTYWEPTDRWFGIAQ